MWVRIQMFLRSVSSSLLLVFQGWMLFDCHVCGCFAMCNVNFLAGNHLWVCYSKKGSCIFTPTGYTLLEVKSGVWAEHTRSRTETSSVCPHTEFSRQWLALFTHGLHWTLHKLYTRELAGSSPFNVQFTRAAPSGAVVTNKDNPPVLLRTAGSRRANIQKIW